MKALTLKKFILSLALFISINSGSATGNFDPALAAQLQNILDSIRNLYNYKGVSASVIIPTKGTWVGASGFSHGNIHLTPGMKFSIASNTKTFISVLMLKLQEMNKLDLDDSLHKWLPRFQYVDSTITIRQLLNHTSGLFNFGSYPGISDSIWADTGRYWTPREIITTFIGNPYFPPGQGWYYSNTNYILAGMVIEAATDTTLAYTLRNLILNPLKLNSTFFPPLESVPDTIAHGSEGLPEITYPITSLWSAVWAAGALFSTAENTTRFYQELINLNIINQSSLNEMFNFTPQSGNAYGLGIIRFVLFGRTMLFHDGSFRGYNSLCGIDSASGFSISVLINQRPTVPGYFIYPMYSAIVNYLIIGIQNNQIAASETFVLHQNYPNPFNPGTTIHYQVPPNINVNRTNVRLIIFDALGQQVAVLVNDTKLPGRYEVSWDASHYPSGIYYYKLYADKFVESKKMILIK